MFGEEETPETYAIIGAAIEVQKHFGTAFLESVYAEALRMELEARGIPFACEVPLALSYKGRPMRNTFRADLICNGNVIVELKVAKETHAAHEAQVLNYLAITGLPIGLLLNFGVRPLQVRRFVGPSFDAPPTSAT